MSAMSRGPYYIDYSTVARRVQESAWNPDKRVVSLLTRPEFFRASPLTSREFVKAFTSELELPGHCLDTLVSVELFQQVHGAEQPAHALPNRTDADRHHRHCGCI